MHCRQLLSLKWEKGDIGTSCGNSIKKMFVDVCGHWSPMRIIIGVGTDLSSKLIHDDSFNIL